MARRAPTRPIGNLFLLLVLVIAGIVVLSRSARELRAPARGGEPPSVPCLVTRVVDGDTIHVDCQGRREKVRLLRVDTPELEESGYHEATDALAEMIADEEVVLRFEDPGRPVRDTHGRLLAYVFLDNLHVNVELVRQGWSPFWDRYGAGRFAADFEAAEEEARSGRRGLWGS